MLSVGSKLGRLDGPFASQYPLFPYLPTQFPCVRVSTPWKVAWGAAAAAFTVSVNIWLAGGITPLSAVNVTLYVPLVPGAGVPLSTPVSGLKPPPIGRPPLMLSAGAGLPEAVTVNVPGVPTVKVAALALVNAGADCGGIPKKIPLITALLALLITLICTCPETFHTR